ncbi:MAG TPA: HAMP domain-containing protein [Chromatiales bacterium]|nr:HAMP domain-containing protein [Chromatiales bacterium]
MGLIRQIVEAVRGTVRYKLLVLVLFPILLVMPIALVLAIYWGTHFTYEQLFIKVNTDLSVAHDVFVRIRQDYQDQLRRLAESYAFRTALEAADAAVIRRQLDALKQETGFSYLHVLDPRGHWLFESSGVARRSLLLRKATAGEAVSGIEIFSAADLQRESSWLAQVARLPLIETPRARPSIRIEEDRGRMIRALYPVQDQRGKLIAILDGGMLLNGNFRFVDAIRDLVYGTGSLPAGSIGTVTVFLDDVRITTNVPLKPGERALGTRVSDEVRTQVLDRGQVWIDRAFVVNDWYISSYEPIVDVNGKRVGMLYAGFLEAPFRISLWRALAALVLMFIVLVVLSAVVAVQGAKSIFKPLEDMSDVVHATRAGRSSRVGKVLSRDEIGMLAQEFDAMLDLLQERNRQIEEWADQLESKVEERTAELQRKNADLRRTIRLLRQTRQQLVVAEKLAALGELTAGVAHEINNPAAVILGNLDVLVDELGPAADPVRNEIDLIIKQIYRIKEIINNLLQYARPQEYAGYIGEMDVNEVVEETIKLVQQLRKSLVFETELDLRSTRKVKINRQELQQVLVNLIVNGIHALPPEGGTVRIQTIDWEDKGVVVRVEDSGYGIDEDELGRIFNPFYSTKGQGEGTGLGLSVSYGLIRRYGGNITVESELGRGSSFFVWLLAEPVIVEDDETIAEQLQAIETDSEFGKDIIEEKV